MRPDHWLEARLEAKQLVALWANTFTLSRGRKGSTKLLFVSRQAERVGTLLLCKILLEELEETAALAQVSVAG